MSHPQRLVLVLAALFWAAGSLTAQPIMRKIDPRDTDRAIDEWTEDHLVFIDPAARKKNILFVFLPGTNLGPAGYTTITRFAASRGFHAVALTYANSGTVNRDHCPGSSDPDCHENVRMEIIDGTDRTPLVTISRANSMENRLIKILQHLQRDFPGENWAQFLEGSEPRWPAIVFAGHSQGAGHAALLGKKHRVARVLMFAGGGDGDLVTGRLAPWMSKPGQTPSSEYYGITHSEDNFRAYPIIWEIFEMTQYGPIVNVDNAQPPYQNSRTMTTTVSADPHGSVVRDSYIPMRGGEPVFAPLWDYYLDGLAGAPTPVRPPAATTPAGFTLQQNFPNPFNPATIIKFSLTQAAPVRLTVYDSLGREIRTLLQKNLPAGSYSSVFDATGLPSGTYFYRLIAGNRSEEKSMRYVK